MTKYFYMQIIQQLPTISLLIPN